MKVKVMVGGGKRSIRASGGAGPGRDERRGRRMVVEKSERRNAEGRKLEPLMGNRVDRTTEQHGIAGWTDDGESWEDGGA